MSKRILIGYGVALLLAAACERSEPGESNVQRGRELLRQQPERALEEFQAAAALKNPEAQLGIALAHEQLGQYAEAEQALLRALEIKPNDLDARLSIARLRILQGNLEQARKDLQGTLGHVPPHVPSLLLFAAIAKTEEEAAAGQKALGALTQPTYASLRESAEYAVAQAALLRAKGDLEASRKLLDASRDKSSLSPELALAVARSFQLSRRARLSEWLLDRAAQNPDAPDEVHWELASVALDLHHVTLAQAAISRLRTEFKPDPKALLLQARLHDLRNLPKESARSTARALEALPRETTDIERRRVTMTHVQALLRAGDTRQAIATLQQFTQTQPDFAPAKVVLAAAYLKRGEPDPAIELLRPVIEGEKPLTDAYPVLVAAYLFKKENAQAEKTAEQFVRNTERSPRSVALWASILSGSGKGEAALSELEQAWKHHPGDPLLAETWVKTAETVRGFRAADDVAKRVANDVEGARLKLLRVYLFSRNQQLTEAEQVLRDIARAHPKDRAVWAELSSIQERQGKLGEAIESLEHLVEIVPFDTTALLKLGTLQHRANDAPRARAAYEQILDVEPGSVVALNNLAVLFTGPLNDPKRAIAMARRAHHAAPKDASVADTLGWALAQSENPREVQEAVSVLRASSRQLRLPEGYYHYGVALHRAGMVEQAAKELRRALSKSKEFAGAEDAVRLLAEISG